MSATTRAGLSLATSSRARGYRGPAILILAPGAGKLVKTTTRVRVTLRLWTGNVASLGFALNRKDIPINRRQVRIYRARGGFIWSGSLTRVRLSSGKNTLVASIRNRRGIRVTATRTFMGPRLLGGSYDLDVTGTTVVKTPTLLRLWSADDPASNNDETPFLGAYDEVVPMARVVTGTDPWHISDAVPFFNIDYQVQRPNGVWTGLWLHAYFEDALLSPNQYGCVVTKSPYNPWGQAPVKPPPMAKPFFCNWTNVHGYNPSPILSVGASSAW
ncbi:MAG: hypothetical protein ACR2MK_07935 [Solirubrobacteraceae bacterium]